MALHTIKVFALLGTAAALGVILASCMEGGGRRNTAAVVPQTSASPYGLFYSDDGSSAKLAYGQANSDNVDIMIQCAKGSRKVEVTNVASASRAPKLTLVSAGASADLKARVEESGEGAVMLIADAPMDSAPLTAFRRAGHLEVAQAGNRYSLTATADERQGVERFFTACERG
jgi:hypothetical protein